MLDINKPVELFNTKTKQIVDLPNGLHEPLRNSFYLDTYPVVTPGDIGWRNYRMDGRPLVDRNPYILRNKKDTGVDFHKPLYADGVRVYLVGPEVRPNGDTRLEFWTKQMTRPSGPYINLALEPYDARTGGSQAGITTFNPQPDGAWKPNPKFNERIKGTLSNDPNFNKKEDTNMALDLNKPLTVNGHEAKLLHKFDNGNLAVVVDGYSEVQNFDSKGRRIGDSVQILKNKVVEEVQYVNIYPGQSDNVQAAAFIYKSLAMARSRFSGSRDDGSGFTLKRVIRDGVIVSNEVI
jgi:hypothetical protein